MALSMAVFVGLRTSGNDTTVYRNMYESIGNDIHNVADINWRNLSAAPGLQLYSFF